MDRATASELEKINVSEHENGNAKSNGEQRTSKTYDEVQSSHSPFWRQAFIALGSFMLSFSAGATAGFSAILIPQLQHAKGKHKYSTEMVSWVAAMASFALLFGNMISGYLMERMGRRASQILLSVFYIGGWTIIGFAGNINFILFGRFITGFCQGWLGPLGPVFVGEISSPAYRGLFLAGLSLSIASGVFMSHLFGTFLHWSHASLLCGAFPLLGCIILYFAPESPAWLASKNEIDRCVQSFQWYRGTSPEMKSELEKMIADQTKRREEKSKLATLTENIKKPEFWKPLCIMIVFFIITQLSGINVICAYTTDIMEVLIGNSSHTYAAMLATDILRVIALVIACVLLRKIGRRPLAIFSGIFTTLSLILLAMYLYLVEKRIIRHISPFISLGLMAIYIFVSNLGISLLPWNMVGELFATETKGLGSGISVMMTSVAFFGTIKTAPAMFQGIGYEGTYLFYGLSTLFGTIFLYFCLPETKGKTLLQIAEEFRYGDRSKRKDKDCVNV
nr:facilitated trehalose transporter Tret1-like isoform X1 [Vanessa tameamea]